MRRMKSGFLAMHFSDGSVLPIGDATHETQAAIYLSDETAFFKKVLLYGDVGFGEAYVDGDWETPSIERVIAWAILNVEQSPGFSGTTVKLGALNLLRVANRVQHLLRPNSKAIARRNIGEHYDLGNAFYELWLDPTMTYSSALFASPTMSLQEAQEAKYRALCEKLRLKASDHLLEVGSGWGGMACFAARHYGCRVTTITISEAQFEYAKARITREGLAELIEIRLQDYREVTGTFDKIVSIEMMEALGDRYLAAYCGQLDRLLKRDGIIALQYITCPDRRHDAMRRGVDWIQKHIFPGSLLLSISKVSEAFRSTGDVCLHQLEDIGLHYARTLHEWWVNVEAKRAEILAQGYSERFLRKWAYYLQYCEAAFTARNIGVVHAVYSRPNNAQLGGLPTS
jgi:cyclopropane-fatty-acyl-phospholipid synthase